MTSTKMTAAATPGQSKGRFGTFGGVFTPNVLTILGIILFLRAGWVVGQAGLTNALIIVGITNAISLLTGLSLSAIGIPLPLLGHLHCLLHHRLHRGPAHRGLFPGP